MTLETDYLIKRGRLADPQTQTTTYINVRNPERPPIVSPDCLLCDPRFYDRNTSFATTGSFSWVSKDYCYIPGDSMIVTTAHKDTYAAMGFREFTDFIHLITRAVNTYRAIPEVQDVTVLQSLGGKAAGQGVKNHFHAHVYPTYMPEVQAQVTLPSAKKFIIQDASSYFLTRIMAHADPGILASTSASLRFPGGLDIPTSPTHQMTVFIIKRLEQAFFGTMSAVQEMLLDQPPHDHILKLAQLADVDLSHRQARIFAWMAKAFRQPDLHLFGINLLFTPDHIVFLPRSGLFGDKRIGAISIFENLHWPTANLGTEITPVNWAYLYEDYPQHLKQFSTDMFARLKQLSQPDLADTGTA